MTWAAPLLAVALLIAVGAVEARVSAEHLAEAVGRPRLEEAGVALTALGLLASALTGAFAGARYCGVREAHTPGR